MSDNKIPTSITNYLQELKNQSVGYVPPMVHSWMESAENLPLVNTYEQVVDVFNNKGITTQAPIVNYVVPTIKRSEKQIPEELNGYIKGNGLKANDKEKIQEKLPLIKNIYTYLQNKLGTTKEQTLGILGNIYAESGFNTGIEEFKNTPNKGFGLIQFTGPRRKALEEYAITLGKDSSDVTTQLDYLTSELNDSNIWTKGGNLSNYKNYKSNSTDDYTYLIMDKFIRPNKKSSNMQLRIDTANYLKDLV